MGRNKLIYALADVAVVVSSAEGSGGTWTGAGEALQAAWVPVLVRADAGAPAGNSALLARGAAPLRSDAVGAAVTAAELVALAPRSASRVAGPVAPDEQGRLFES